MVRTLGTLIAAILVLLFLAACLGSATPEPGPPDTISPASCVTATPTGGVDAVGVSVIATPAGRTTPAGGSPDDQLFVSPSDLATREAQLEQQNRPVQVPTASEAGATTLPVCPTLTPMP